MIRRIWSLVSVTVYHIYISMSSYEDMVDVICIILTIVGHNYLPVLQIQSSLLSLFLHLTFTSFHLTYNAETNSFTISKFKFNGFIAFFYN